MEIRHKSETLIDLSAWGSFGDFTMTVNVGEIGAADEVEVEANLLELMEEWARIETDEPDDHEHAITSLRAFAVKLFDLSERLESEWK